MKEETLDRIDRYLRGEMTDSEKEDFENLLAQDNTLRQRVELMRDIIDAVETRAMKEHLAEMNKTQRQRRRFYRIGSIVAALAACLLLAVFFLRVGNDNVPVPVFSPFVYEIPERGGTYSQDVVRMLKDGLYDEALLLIDSLETAYRSEDSLVLAKEIKTEEDIYIHESDSIALYHLGWLRIQALTGKKKYREVRDALERYRFLEGDYRDKADSLWMLLE